MFVDGGELVRTADAEYVRYECRANLNPHVRARRLAHHLGIPWEKVETLTLSLEIDLESMLGACPDDEVCRHVISTWDASGEQLKKCASPIEELLLCSIAQQFPWFEWNANLDPGAPIAWSHERRCAIYAQHRVDRWRLDFAIIHRDFRMCVECDGHDYHERTKAQAERDRSRDRHLTADGWKVLRFTGSEIWRDPRDRGRELLNLVTDLGNEPGTPGRRRAR